MSLVHVLTWRVDAAVKLGEQYKSLPINHFCVHTLGVDPGFSSSRTSLVLTEHMEEHDKIRIIYSEELVGHPNPSDIVQKVFKIVTETQNTWYVHRWLCEVPNNCFEGSI